MSKYQPLASHLRGSGQDSVPIGFEEIETIIGTELPPSAYRYRAWWSNNPTNGAMTRAWLEAGYISAKVDMAGRRLVFRKWAPGEGLFAGVFGALKGTVRTRPGTDLAAPVDTGWGAGR